MIDFAASEIQYAEHLLPIWNALEPQERGTFYGSRAVQMFHVKHRLEPWKLQIGHPPRTGRPIIVASYQDLRNARDRRVVLVEHGAGQSYVDADHPSYAGGPDRGCVVLFLCPNENVAKRNRDRYPDAVVAVIGSPRLDTFLHTTAAEPVTAISFHADIHLVPETRWAFPHYEKALPALASSVQLIGHAHPRVWSPLSRRYRSLGIEAVERFGDVLERAGVYVCDNSSTLFEAAAAGLQVVVLDAPWYRRDVEHGLRFWEHANIGPRISDPGDLVDAVNEAWRAPERYQAARERALTDVFSSLDGQASLRAAQAIRGVVYGKPVPTDHHDPAVGPSKASRSL